MATFHHFGPFGFVGMLLFPFFWLLCSCAVSASVVSIIGNDDSLSFEAVDANFAPAVIASGVYGDLYLAKPLNACSELKNEVNRLSNLSSSFVLIVRGNCSFEEKVRRAQKASFKAVIVYNNEENGQSVEMSGNSDGIKIPAVFVSREAGDVLTSFAGSKDVELWIIPDFDDSTWCIMVVSFFSLLVISATLAICFFVRRHRIRLEWPQSNSRVREFHGMSSRLVKAMPSLIFTSVLEDNCTSVTCAICLEDYSIGEKLRILPCRHKFHALCVDMWLTTWRTFCPVCKRDAKMSNGEPPASESTPLLSPSPSASSVASIYARSSVPSSSTMRISQLPTPSWALALSIPNSQMMSHQSLRPCCYSPAMSVSRSTNDLMNASSRRSHLVSPHSMGYASSSLSPRNSRFMSLYVPSPSYGSSSHLGSSQQNQDPLHRSESESAASFSPFASSDSLPDC